jgi:hypothetical protein
LLNEISVALHQMINERHYKTSQQVLLEITSLLIILPLAPFLNRYIPPVILGEWNVDLLLALIISFVVVRLLLLLFRPLIIPLFILCSGYFLFNMFTQGYSFRNVVQDYRSVVVNNWGTKDTKQQDILSIDPGLFLPYHDKTVRGIRSKVNFEDSLVRNYSVLHSLEDFNGYFNKYGTLVRHLSLFKHINANFKYVSDNNRDEYFATPKETILNGLGGDCDDHSILMVSCLQSIGAKCRIVLIEGHAYPELYCGNKTEFEIVQQAIIQLFSNQRIREFHYHENNGQYWLNLDYTARRPGGPYVNDKIRALVEF